MAINSTFSGIEIVRQGLLANRLATDVIAHNLANATNPRYSRQVPSLVAANPFSIPSLNRIGGAQLGMGARLASIHRVRSGFIEAQIRQNSMDLSAWQVVQTTMQRVSGIFNNAALDLKDRIQDLATKFFDLSRIIGTDRLAVATDAVQTTMDVQNSNQWSVGDVIQIGAEQLQITGIAGITLTVTRGFNSTTSTAHLANDLVQLAGSEDGARAQVRAEGMLLAGVVRSGYQDLDQLAIESDKQIQLLVVQANSSLSAIADLNGRILQASMRGMTPNDLMDSRDAHLQNLAQLMDYNLRTLSDGSIYLSTQSGEDLVRGTRAGVLNTMLVSTENGRFVEIGLAKPNQLFPTKISADIRGGALGGFLQVRNENISYYMTKLNEVTRSVIDQVNAIHEAGYAKDGVSTDISFFVGQDARDISVNSIITPDNNYQMIAASSVRVPAAFPNGEIAAMLASLPTLMMNERMESRSPVFDGFIGIPINPVLALNDPAQNFATLPALAGTISINGLAPMAWDNTQSIFEIVGNMNQVLNTNGYKNTHVVFNEGEQKFFILSDESVIIEDITGNFTNWTDLRSMVRSSTTVSQRIDIAMGWLDPTIALDTRLATLKSNVSLSDRGSFDITAFDAMGTPVTATVTWDNTMSLNNILAQINSIPIFSVTQISATFDPSRQQIRLISASPDRTFRIADVEGNFTRFANLENVGRFEDFASSLPQESLADSEIADSQVLYLTDSQLQIEAQRSAISDVIAEQELADLLRYEKAFSALVQVLSVYDSMLNTLINRTGAGGGSVTFGDQK